MQEIHACCCLMLLVVLVAASQAAGQPDLRIREYTPSDSRDWDLARRLSGISGIPRDHARWPVLWDDSDPRRRDAGVELVAEADGLIVGRVRLEVHHQPYCELVNLGVRPDYRNLGAATALVREAITRARSLGFKVMVLQEALDDAPAQGIYEKAGFVRATRGTMQRMVKLLDVPLVSTLLSRNPQADFSSAAAPEQGEKCWRLRWQAAPDDFVALYLCGGSCQFDSDGFQLVTRACEFATKGVALKAEVEMAGEVRRGQTADMLVSVENRGAEVLHGCVRAVLLPDTDIGAEGPAKAVPLELAAGKRQTVAIPIRIKHEFRCDFLPFGRYPSVPITADVCWEEGSVLLSSAVKVQTDWGGAYPG